jgi:methyltransferase
VSVFWAVLALVVAQRLAELVYARRNTRRLLADGAAEVGAGHYPLIVAVHVGWLAALLVSVPADAAPNWWLLGLFLAVQFARIWVMMSLGPYWTTRVLSIPGAPLVRRGPYRWVRHPNYMVVVTEIALLPLAFGAWDIAVVFSLLNAIVLTHRIRVENAALAERRSAGGTE